MKTKAAPPMKAGHFAVMQRWLMSAQKLSCKPSVTISRLPNRTTRAPGVRSLWPFNIDSISLKTSAEAFDHARRHVIIKFFQRIIWQPTTGVSSYVRSPRAKRPPGPDPRFASDPDDRRHARGQGEAQTLQGAGRREAEQDARQAHDPGRDRAGQALLRGRSSSYGACASRRRHQGHPGDRDRRSQDGRA